MKELLDYTNNKKILLVGGSPSASNKSKEWYDSFDIIVRFNNYKKVNSNRTDIYCSYFGRNIKKTVEELKNDGVKFLINKCPNSDMTYQLANSNIDMKDYRWIYENRKDWWFCPVISLTEEELINQINLIDGYMPTVGLSMVLFFTKSVNPISIIGFDCFESGIHNLDEKWDYSGNHNLTKEKEILEKLEKEEKIKWIE